MTTTGHAFPFTQNEFNGVCQNLPMRSDISLPHAALSTSWIWQKQYIDFLPLGDGETGLILMETGTRESLVRMSSADGRTDPPGGQRRGGEMCYNWAVVLSTHTSQ